MDTVLNFMDKIYSDSNTLSMIYIVGAILLFAFIIMLIFSLRKPKEETKIIEEPVEDKTVNEKIHEEVKEEDKETTENKIEPILDAEPEKEDIFKVLDRVEEEKKELVNIPRIEEKYVETNISSSIPDVDEYVDNIVKKTYEKNEQFSSVYVGDNTSTIKLDKVLDKMNVDEDIKEEIVPDEEKSTIKVETEEDAKNIEINKEPKSEIKEVESKPAVLKEGSKVVSSLDALKKSLEEKKQEVNSKQDDLKSKLESLKANKTVSNETMKAEDLLNKLNSLKDTK